MWIPLLSGTMLEGPVCRQTELILTRLYVTMIDKCGFDCTIYSEGEAQNTVS